MYLITEQQLLAMNAYIVRDDEDCRPGIRDGAGADLYFQLEAINCESDPFTKAALALFTANSHIFNNGNKRTAFALADSILGEYGCYIKENEGEIVRFVCWIASIEVPEKMDKEDLIKEILNWVRPRIYRLE